MKKIKILLILFVISCVLPILNAAAYVDGYFGLLTVSIPKSKDDWYYSGFGHNKTQDSPQYYNNGGTIDTLGGEIAIQGRTWDGSLNSYWLNLVVDKYSTWGENNTNVFKGTYGIDLRRKSSGLFASKHSGIWYLNENKLPASAK